jgi:hypothetical protein
MPFLFMVLVFFRVRRVRGQAPQQDTDAQHFHGNQLVLDGENANLTPPLAAQGGTQPAPSG